MFMQYAKRIQSAHSDHPFIGTTPRVTHMGSISDDFAVAARCFTQIFIEKSELKTLDKKLSNIYIK